MGGLPLRKYSRLGGLVGNPTGWALPAGKATTSVSMETGLSERYGKPNLIPMSIILDSPPATSTGLSVYSTSDVGAKVPIGGRSYAQVLMMRTR
jgi:hypothetical protein